MICNISWARGRYSLGAHSKMYGRLKQAPTPFRDGMSIRYIRMAYRHADVRGTRAISP